MTAAGGAARQVTELGAQDQPDWSPDGRLLAYAYGSILAPEENHVIRPDRTGDAPVTDGASTSDSTPAWDPSWQPR